MSRTSVGIIVSLVAAVWIAPALAQSSSAPASAEPGNVVLIARYNCNAADLTKVDEILKGTTAPVLNRMVSEGKLIGWGVLGTTIGGPESRTIYVWAKDAVALMKARAEYLPEIMAKPGWAEVQRACPSTEISINTLIMKTQPVAK